MSVLTLPCQAKPTAWEITGGHATKGCLRYADVQRAVAAASLCGTCPVLAECAAAAAANPPAHRCVQGGMVFELTGAFTTVPVEPAKWAAKFGPPPTLDPATAPPCAVCGGPLPDTRSGRRFCSAVCINRNHNRKRSQREADNQAVAA